MTPQEKLKIIEANLADYRKSDPNYDEDACYYIDWLIARVKKLEKALTFVEERENFAFAECSVAEELWSTCKQALESE